MTLLVSLLFISIFVLEYLALKLEVISRFFTLMPEVFSFVIILVIVGRGLVLRRWEQSNKYLWLLVAFVLVCMIGVVAQNVEAGPVISGLRNYFKCIPFLLLPAVYRFSERQLNVLIGVFLGLAALQVPLAFFQRFVQFSDRMHTGDPVTGTVATSSSLTITLCVAIAIIMTLYAHRRLSFGVAAVLFCYFAAPTAINETKATLILLPLATIGPFVLARGVEDKWKRLVPVLVICAIGLVGFATIYNMLIEFRWEGIGLGERFTSGRFFSYLYRGVGTDQAPKVIGRFDSMILPVMMMSEDWMRLFFGVGIGNASPAFLPGMEGQYFEAFREFGFGMTAIGNIIWEMGLVGVAIYVTLFLFIWQDARFLARYGQDDRWLGTWWSVCVLIFLFGLTYKTILNFNEAGYMLFFWSGVLASRSWQIRNKILVTDDEQNSVKLKLAGRVNEPTVAAVLTR